MSAGEARPEPASGHAYEPSVPPSLPVWFGRVVVASFRRELLEAARYRAAFVTRFAGFLLAAASLVFFSRFVASTPNPHLAPYGGGYLAFGLCGLVAAELQQVGVMALANRVRMAQLMGFMEAQLSTPAPAALVLGAQPLLTMAAAVVRAVIYLVAAALVLDVGFRPHALTLLIGVPLALAAFAGLGLLNAAIIMLMRRTSPLGLVLASASALASGVVYPVTVLPPWLASLGQWLPLTHALEVLRRGLLTGAAPTDVSGSLSALGAFAVAISVLGGGLFAWALRRARVDGSLSQF